MTRMICALMAVAVCAGCRNPPQAYDPFLGRTTVEPPGTATMAPSAPYYNSSPAGSAPIVSPPMVTPPAGTTLPPSAPPTTPLPPIPHAVPQGFTPAPAGLSKVTPNVSMPGGTLVQPATNTHSLASAAPSATRPAYGPPGGMSYPQLLSAAPAQQPTLAQPTAPGLLRPESTAGAVDIRGSAPGSSPSGGMPAKWEAAGSGRSSGSDAATASVSPAEFTSPTERNTIRIVEPPRSPSAVSTTSANGGGEFRPAGTSSLTMPSGAASSGTLNQSLSRAPLVELADLPPVRSLPISSAPASPAGSSSGAYGYDSQYRWVKGKLEYTQSTRSWRLRYIPPDAANDNYGGSVILADAGKLTGLQPGDFVEAYGSLGPAGADKSSFAALYNVERIQKQ